MGQDLELQTEPLLPASSLRHDRPFSRISTFSQGFLAAGILCAIIYHTLDFRSIESCPDPIQKDRNFPSPTQWRGPTATGKESFLIATGLPSLLEDHYPLVSNVNVTFDMFAHFGNLASQTSVPSSAFGLPNATPIIPQGYELEQVHLLHRHGARYSTGTLSFVNRLKDAKEKGNFRSRNKLAFLNDWEDKLGLEILTPFGRLQLFKLGVKFRLQYGQLLTKAKTKLVHRTTTQDRMLNSALNFHAGFYGLPFESQYHQLYQIEAVNFNNTLCGDLNCPHSARMDGYSAVRKWVNQSLSATAAAMQKDVDGLDLTAFDVFSMMQVCSYETVALGYSIFCDLFSQDDFEAYSYGWDLMFYATSFGDPIGSAIGLGWVEELVSRLTQTRLLSSSSNVNSTITSDPTLFPLDQPIYIDATHDTTITAVLAAMGFTNLATSEMSPDRIPARRSFFTSQIVPFAAHLQGQVVRDANGDRWIRFILNDGVLPLSHLPSCGDSSDGFCPFDAFVQEMQARISQIDFQQLCFGAQQ